MIDEEQLKHLEGLAKQLEERRSRAASRLSGESGRFWFFALVGFEIEHGAFEFAPLGFIRRVTEPPGEVALAAAMKDRALFGVIGRYSRHVNYELAISRDLNFDDKTCFTLAYHFASALRVKSLTEFLVPAVSDHSWSTIEAITDASCVVRLLEDVPAAQRIYPTTPVSTAEASWAADNFHRYLGLAADPKFVLATEALTAQHHIHSKRLMSASLWSGIEALFEIQSELRFRISALVATVLETRGASRRELAKKVQKLYDVRSKAVHGSSINDTALIDHVKEVRQLLSRLLCRFVELEKIPSAADLEEELFG